MGYKKGRRFEYEVKRHLENQGYFVFRSAKSSRPDLIALKGKEVLAVECKVDKYLSKEEKDFYKWLGKNTIVKPVLFYPGVNEKDRRRKKLKRKDLLIKK